MILANLGAVRLWSPSSTRVRVLVFAEQLKDMHQIVMYILWKWTRILFYTHFLWFWIPALPSDQFSSVAQSCPSLWDPMDCSIPGFPVPHQLLEFTQTHVHWVGDANQPTHSLSYPSPPAFNLSQHQGLFKWVSSSHQVARVLEFQLQHQSFQWIFRTDFL